MMFYFCNRNDSKHYHSTEVLTDRRDQIYYIPLCRPIACITCAGGGGLIATTFMLPDERRLSSCCYNGKTIQRSDRCWHFVLTKTQCIHAWSICPTSPSVTVWRVEGRSNQYVVVNLHREFRYGVKTADEGLRPISPSKLKDLPHPSGRRY